MIDQLSAAFTALAEIQKLQGHVTLIIIHAHEGSADSGPGPEHACPTRMWSNQRR